MIVELRISDFATIEQLELRFDNGFNVLTGETGAGKSIILDAVTMLLGGKADTAFIRSGRKRAYLEGTFRLSSALVKQILPVLEAEGLEGDSNETIILARELRTSGRAVCRVNGRATNISLLKQLAQPFVDIHGQNQHLSLLRQKEHQRMLDRFGGLETQREKYARQVAELRIVRDELDDLRRNERALARRLDQLSYQVEEIDEAELEAGEEAGSEIERKRLGNAEQLSQITGGIYQLLLEPPDESQPSVSDLLGQINRLFGQLLKIDESMSEHAETAENIGYQIEDLAGYVRDYMDELEYNPHRLQEVEDRLHLISTLKRKYGDSIEEILAYAEKARAEADKISNSDARIAELSAREEKLRHSAGILAGKLSKVRHKVSQELGNGITGHLADLGLKRARFEVEITQKDNPEGLFVPENGTQRVLAYDEVGVDKIEFLLSANPGEPLKSLAKVASGGEMSRIMLALKTVLAAADDTPTLIFDEIDQGTGGRIGHIVGQKLWELTRHGQHQVLCVTHTPQIAGFADRHYHVRKQVIDDRTHSQVLTLTPDERVDEVAHMLGSTTEATKLSAREIIAEAKRAKG